MMKGFQDRGAPPCTSPAASLLICLTLAMVEVIVFVFVFVFDIAIAFVFPPSPASNLGWHKCCVVDRLSSQDLAHQSADEEDPRLLWS